MSQCLICSSAVVYSCYDLKLCLHFLQLILCEERALASVNSHQLFFPILYFSSFLILCRNLFIFSPLSMATLVVLMMSPAKPNLSLSSPIVFKLAPVILACTFPLVTQKCFSISDDVVLSFPLSSAAFFVFLAPVFLVSRRRRHFPYKHLLNYVTVPVLA